jgi:DNA primase large subunit
MGVRGPPAVGDAAFYGDYPFLPGAEALAAELAPSVRTLLEEPSLARARELGRARLRSAAEDPRGSTELEELERADPAEKFLSFQYARILLGAAPSAAPQRRWAVAEAKRAGGRLARAGVEELLALARRLGVELVPSGERMALPLADYLRLATPIREAEFRLVRQSVARGRVLVAPGRAARLLEEGIRRSLTDAVALSPELVERVRAEETEFLSELARRIPAPPPRPRGGGAALDPAAFPPCIRKMRRTLQEGENLSHAGRFALAAFLHRIGADAETIVDTYRGAPDFDESITRYQVEHITRHQGGEGYDPPECETLRSHGLCAREGDPAAPAAVDRARDELCFEPRLRHPLIYYRIRTGRAPPAEAEGGRGTSPGPARGRSTGRRG